MSEHLVKKTLPSVNDTAIPTLKSLFDLLSQVKSADFSRFKNRLVNLKKSNNTQNIKVINQISIAINQSIENKQFKLKNLPKISFPAELPISQNADQISKAINENQVVIIAGETGSGKTTQIPKICRSEERRVGKEC